mmetsp:Transcript_10859/g.36586  ORF Transcript_10859/g.36586 Transcript_10859/m.36586 type:complete len:106 (-) Transcript_10859:701-1018(-)
MWNRASLLATGSEEIVQCGDVAMGSIAGQDSQEDNGVCFCFQSASAKQGWEVLKVATRTGQDRKRALYPTEVMIGSGLLEGEGMMLLSGTGKAWPRQRRSSISVR